MKYNLNKATKILSSVDRSNEKKDGAFVSEMRGVTRTAELSSCARFIRLNDNGEGLSHKEKTIKIYVGKNIQPVEEIFTFPLTDR